MKMLDAGAREAWRARRVADDPQRMNGAADFAFRQAWALFPYTTKALVRNVQFLISDKRLPEALIVAETSSKLR